MALPFEIRAAVLCDDVRQESTGKFILIGVYVGSVLVTGFPAQMLLHLWAEIAGTETGKFTGVIRVIKDDGSILARGGIEAIGRLGPSVLHIPRMPIEFQGKGAVKFQVNFSDNEEWHTIMDFVVDLADTPISQPSAS